MKKSKKILSAVMAAAMLLTGCGNEADGGNVTSDNGAAAVTEVGTSNDEEIVSGSETNQDLSSQTDSEISVSSDMLTGTLSFDTTVTHQVMDGFGAAYTWYGDRLAKAQNSEEGYDALFSDAKLTILRFKNEYSYNVAGKASNAIAMADNYKEARDRAALYGEKVQVLLCCWSPPAYLKSDGTIDNGNGTLAKDENGNYMYEEYADWWVESVKYYQSKGVVVDYVSIQNEVDFSPSDYEGCRFGARETDSVAGYAEAFCAVYEAFREAFGDDAPTLLGPETMSCESSSLLSYANAINELNPDALGGLAFHLYVGGTSDSDTLTVKPTTYLTNFTGMETYFPDTKKWETEFYIGQGIQTAELIWSALTNAEMNAYLYWSAIWADSTPDKFESADLMEIDNSGNWRLTANYYALRHYSEFIRPGYTRIDAATDQPKLKVCAFTNDDANKVAVVIVNSSAYDVAYNITGNDYTITDSAVYQSVFGESATDDSQMYQAIGSLGNDGLVIIPAGSVTTIDITGYYGDTEIPVAEITPITYDEGVLENPDLASAETSDGGVLISTDFSNDSMVNAFSGFGSSIVRQVADGGEDGTGCMIVKMRQDSWNGAQMPEAYFEKYGYLVKVSYDCMMEEDGQSVSCTSTFSVGGSSYYPDGENNRVAVSNMEAGKWYHAEGYVTMYSNMDQGSFKLYWESPDNTNDIYLDNIEVTVMSDVAAGEYNP